MVSINDSVGRFVPVVMVVERGDATGTLSSSDINVLYSIPLYCTMHQSGERDS
jgi:hypothetical protein